MSTTVADSAEKPKYKRKLRNFWLNPSYQLRYIGWLGSIAMIMAVVQGIFFYIYAKGNYDYVISQLPNLGPEIRRHFYEEINKFIYTLGAVNLGFLLVLGLIGIVISHRTVGPLYHFKRVFKELRNGKLDSRVSLRPHDNFHDLEEEFNAMVDALVKGSK